MPWHIPGWQFPCWAEMTTHMSEQAVHAAVWQPSMVTPTAAESIRQSSSHLVHDLSTIPACPEDAGPRILKEHILWPGARQPRGSPTKDGSVLSLSMGTIRVQVGCSHGGPNWSSKQVTSSQHKELAGVKQAQEETNGSYESGHSPERQLFILPLSQGGFASASQAPGLRKPPALTQGSHKYPGARKQEAWGSNSHPNSLFRGGHNSTISSVYPSSPIQLPTFCA